MHASKRFLFVFLLASTDKQRITRGEFYSFEYPKCANNQKGSRMGSAGIYPFGYM